MEYHPEWELDYKAPMSKVKKPKDPGAQDKAIRDIMQLAIYGAVMCPDNQNSQFEAVERVMALFKEAGLLK